jgi:TM2 domain-containing membrane protein YozV
MQAVRTKIVGRKSILIAYLLLFLFSGLGVHRFYLGRVGTGLLMFLLTLVGVVTSIIGIGYIVLVLVGIWLFLDLFFIPYMATHVKMVANIVVQDNHTSSSHESSDN